MIIVRWRNTIGSFATGKSLAGVAHDPEIQMTNRFDMSVVLLFVRRQVDRRASTSEDVSSLFRT